jgi:hypothetical protein
MFHHQCASRIFSVYNFFVLLDVSMEDDDDHEDMIPIATARVIHDGGDDEDEDDDIEEQGQGKEGYDAVEENWDDDNVDDDNDDDDDDDDVVDDDDSDNEVFDNNRSTASSEENSTQSQSNNSRIHFGMGGKDTNSSSDEADDDDPDQNVTSYIDQNEEYSHNSASEENSDISEAEEALQDYNLNDGDKYNEKSNDIDMEFKQQPTETEEETEQRADADDTRLTVTKTSEQSNVDNNGFAPEQTQLQAWIHVHQHLTDAVMVARQSVEAKKRQRRFWLETICANLTPEGKLTTKSTWTRPTAVDLRNYRKNILKKSSKTLEPATTQPKAKVPRKGQSSILKGRKHQPGGKSLNGILKAKNTLKKTSTAISQSRKRKVVSEPANYTFDNEEDHIETGSRGQKKTHRLKLSVGNVFDIGKQQKNETRGNNDDSDDGVASDNDVDNVAVEVRHGLDDDNTSSASGGDSDDEQNANNDVGDSDGDNDDDNDDEDSNSAASVTLSYPSLQVAKKFPSFEPDVANDASSSEDDSPVRSRHPYLDAPWSAFNRNSFTGVQAGLDSEQIYSTYNAAGDVSAVAAVAAAAAGLEESESEEDPF